MKFIRNNRRYVCVDYVDQSRVQYRSQPMKIRKRKQPVAGNPRQTSLWLIVGDQISRGPEQGRTQQRNHNLGAT